jgi:hypothetical protein
MRLLTFLIVVLFIFSCTSEEDELYDEMTASFCECYRKDTTPSEHKDYTQCIETTTAKFQKKLAEVGLDPDNVEIFDKITNQGFFSDERLKKYCPSYNSDIRTEFKKQVEMREVKRVFIGRFFRQQQSVGTGKPVYAIDLKDEKDSVYQFLSDEPINNVSQGESIEVHYHELNRHQKFVDSIAVRQSF